MVLASIAHSIGEIAHPFFIAFAWLIAIFYSVIPNYAIAIALLTVTVMIVVFPINRRATRSMMKMQLLAPELKKLQTKYKVQPGMGVQDKQERRQRLNEEMMALYKENNVSPTGGCLPMVLQFPIFWILYGTIRGLTHEIRRHGHVVLQPLYIKPNTRLYHNITTQNLHTTQPHLNAFGINLADSVRTTGLSWGGKIPFIALILVAIALQYIQMKQLSGRNPAAAAANPQMQTMQKVFPIIFAVIYISIPAGVNVYFIVSALFRIGQQEFMYRRDPHIRESMAKIHARTGGVKGAKVVDTRLAATGAAKPKGLLARLSEAAMQNGTAASEPAAKPADAATGKANRNGQAGAANSGNGAKAPQPRPPRQSQTRSQAKRPRRPR